MPFGCCCRPTLSSLSTVAADDRPIRFTDSPQHYNMPSTMSTTSGLGSNYTTNTSTGLSASISCMTQPPTPSPRRKTSSTSFSEVEELQLERDNRAPIYIPGNYVQEHQKHNPLSLVDNGITEQPPAGSAYFGKALKLQHYLIFDCSNGFYRF